MSGAAAAAGTPSARRQRVGLVLGCWIVAGCLIVGQLLIARQIYVQEELTARISDHVVVPSDDWRLSGALLPLLLVAAALTMQICWLRSVWRTLSKFTACLFVPFSLLCLLSAEVRGPIAMVSVRLSNGQRFIMAYELAGLDVVYTLYEDADVAGLTWRQLGWLSRPEDGPFHGGEHLVSTRDEQWLLAARGGVWTDCFRLVGGRPMRVEVQPYPAPNSPSYEADMRLRSARIAALTGMRP